MIKHFKTLIATILVCTTCMVALTGCGSYKYNYKGENFKLQYDESLFVVDYATNSNYNDVFIHTNDGNYLAYVDVALVDVNYGQPREILENLQKYFTTFANSPEIINEKQDSSKGSYNKATTTIETYDYTIKSETSTQIIKSRVETIGMQQFIVVERYFDGVYDNQVINALDLAYESATPVYK